MRALDACLVNISVSKSCVRKRVLCVGLRANFPTSSNLSISMKNRNFDLPHWLSEATLKTQKTSQKTSSLRSFLTILLNHTISLTALSPACPQAPRPVRTCPWPRPHQHPLPLTTPTTTTIAMWCMKRFWRKTRTMDGKKCIGWTGRKAVLYAPYHRPPPAAQVSCCCCSSSSSSSFSFSSLIPFLSFLVFACFLVWVCFLAFVFSLVFVFFLVFVSFLVCCVLLSYFCFLSPCLLFQKRIFCTTVALFLCVALVLLLPVFPNTLEWLFKNRTCQINR